MVFLFSPFGGIRFPVSSGSQRLNMSNPARSLCLVARDQGTVKAWMKGLAESDCQLFLDKVSRNAISYPSFESMWCGCFLRIPQHWLAFGLKSKLRGKRGSNSVDPAKQRQRAVIP